MCGRYYVDDDTIREMEILVRQMDQKQQTKLTESINCFSAGDICPGKDAPVLTARNGSIYCKWQRWGFPWQQDASHPSGTKLIFNARCESALEKPLFRDGILHRRVVIPASCFYEWNPRKEKNTFRQKDKAVLFMAGFSRKYEDGEHFVILTTEANDSMKPVHDRMPLILRREEITEWISDNTKTENILHKIPCLLERSTDYEQLRLF